MQLQRDKKQHQYRHQQAQDKAAYNGDRNAFHTAGGLDNREGEIHGGSAAIADSR